MEPPQISFIADTASFADMLAFCGGEPALEMYHTDGEVSHSPLSEDQPHSSPSPHLISTFVNNVSSDLKLGKFPPFGDKSYVIPPFPAASDPFALGCDQLLTPFSEQPPPPLQPYEANPPASVPASFPPPTASAPSPQALPDAPCPMLTQFTMQPTPRRTRNNNSSSQRRNEPVQCPLPNCGKTFTRYHNLRAHLRTHEPTRPFACSTCPRAFTRKHDLQRHMRVHTGDKPYACPCCSKAFARTDAMMRHFKIEETCRNSPAVAALKGRRYRRYSSVISRISSA
ncbi:uncharacterized protein VTP21DRAFT_1448 [Calcarisporiella thermophila]|uniref:uncharacterized protein n=1 Tax=Calcarisporiella thermophila TaxID=911321 RepID=UPI003742BEA6